MLGGTQGTASTSGRSCLPSRTQGTARHFCRRRLYVAAAKVFDNSVRVKGDARRVFLYVSDFSNLPAWYPGVKSVKKLTEHDVTVKSVFEVERLIYQWTHKSRYEIIEYEAGKKVTYKASSDVHTATHHLHFMPDPSDRTFTNIRYLKQFELRGSLGPLQPLVAGVLGKLPEEGLQNLSRSLARSDTPLRFIPVAGPDEVEHLSQQRARKQPGNGWSWQSLMDGLSSVGSMDGGPSESPVMLDALGYYSLLGLDARHSMRLTPEEIKAAYRRAAMDLHPDKFANAPEADRASAQARFQRLQKAYAILRQPSQKAIYDSGKILADFVV